MNPICESCGKELVEVDNPIRSEIRHRRGEEVQCPAWREAAGLRKLVCENRHRWWRGVRLNLQPGNACPTCSRPLVEDDALSHRAPSDVNTTDQSRPLIPGHLSDQEVHE